MPNKSQRTERAAQKAAQSEDSAKNERIRAERAARNAVDAAETMHQTAVSIEKQLEQLVAAVARKPSPNAWRFVGLIAVVISVSLCIAIAIQLLRRDERYQNALDVGIYENRPNMIKAIPGIVIMEPEDQAFGERYLLGVKVSTRSTGSIKVFISGALDNCYYRTGPGSVEKTPTMDKQGTGFNVELTDISPDTYTIVCDLQSDNPNHRSFISREMEFLYASHEDSNEDPVLDQVPSGYQIFPIVVFNMQALNSYSNGSLRLWGGLDPEGDGGQKAILSEIKQLQGRTAVPDSSYFIDHHDSERIMDAVGGSQQIIASWQDEFSSTIRDVWILLFGVFSALAVAFIVELARALIGSD